MPYRILSLDGSSISGGTGYVATGMLGALRQTLDTAGERRTLLNQVDLFVGTSAGSFNAAFFAREEDPDSAYDRNLQFWGEAVAMNKKGVSLGRTLKAMTGTSSLLDSNYMRDYLSSYFGKTTRLGDLKRKVVIPSFQLDGTRKGLRTWKSKVFHNTGPETDPDLDELLVDVLMRSGSPPLSYPIYQGSKDRGSGYVDGGLYANNPSLVGLAQAINNISRPNKHESVDTLATEPPSLESILVLSMGNGIMSAFLDPTFKDGEANWGFAPWLLNLRDPMVLVKMLLEAGSDAVNYQCRMILRKKYLRLDPTVDQRLSAYDSQEVGTVLVGLLSQQGTMDQLQRAKRWVEKSGWLGEAQQGAQPSQVGT
ncbi:patatin-like phospholipase family protein [Myxococcus stipitatus DSM 14675]|uniref:Patatin-like phospholipase family protein n=1 Tax=Myxococcus stipitatus (strain DSM 14675 / JCM 12634 / Mx s8) TaxID=1278073 RepID=L7UGZ1_MYXSD|nr:patatin-like phospholipase family protein [Myxococcus stipitatus]AGC47283.1 patatin-like phospholipase family protein [Myxococcus stipitatus DSM 14675]